MTSIVSLIQTQKTQTLFLATYGLSTYHQTFPRTEFIFATIKVKFTNSVSVELSPLLRVHINQNPALGQMRLKRTRKVRLVTDAKEESSKFR